MKDLVFEKAAVHAIKLKLANSKVTGTLEVRAVLNEKLAKQLGVELVLFNRRTAEHRVGYAGVDLEAALVDFRFVLWPQGLAKLEFTSSMAHDFRVEKKRDGKGKLLLLVFKVLYTGTITDLIGWWEINGAVPGPLTLRSNSDQNDLFAPPAEEKPKGKPGRKPKGEQSAMFGDAEQRKAQELAAQTAGKENGKKRPGPQRVQ